MSLQNEGANEFMAKSELKDSWPVTPALFLGSPKDLTGTLGGES